MIESLLLVAGGLLGAGHCIGMCGGFALTLGSAAKSPWNNLARQSIYAAGRVSVYVLAGAFVGFGTWRLGRDGLGFAQAQACLSIVAGLFLVAEGLFSAGWLPRPFAAKQGCPRMNVFASLLRAPNLSAVFVGGLVNGMLPCGLVYAYLALAASSGNLFTGAAVMALFGLGTVPVLILTGLTGSMLGLVWRRRIFRVAAYCMILTGLLALWRGIAAFPTTDDPDPPCPFCVEAPGDITPGMRRTAHARADWHSEWTAHEATPQSNPFRHRPRLPEA
jgi:sulfite exporter TauE/SafE